MSMTTLGFFCADACVLTAIVATSETNRPSQMFLRARIINPLQKTGRRPGARESKSVEVPLLRFANARFFDLDQRQITSIECGNSLVLPCKNTPVPGLPEVPGAVDQKTTRTPDAATPGHLVQVLRRHGQEPDAASDEGPLTLDRSRDGGRGNFRPRRSTSLTATTRRRTGKPFFCLLQPGRACTSRPCCRRSTRPCSA